jgi:hypothetical protein
MAVSTDRESELLDHARLHHSSAGGQYSSSRDLRTWGAAILRSAQIAPFVTRRWMKPSALTGQLTHDIGVTPPYTSIT